MVIAVQQCTMLATKPHYKRDCDCKSKVNRDYIYFFLSVQSLSTPTRWFIWRTMTSPWWWRGSCLCTVLSVEQGKTMSVSFRPYRWSSSRSWKVPDHTNTIETIFKNILPLNNSKKWIVNNRKLKLKKESIKFNNKQVKIWTKLMQQISAFKFMHLVFTSIQSYLCFMLGIYISVSPCIPFKSNPWPCHC